MVVCVSVKIPAVQASTPNYPVGWSRQGPLWECEVVFDRLGATASPLVCLGV